MSPWTIWFIQEAIKIAITRLQGIGALDGITEEQAKAEIQRLTETLPAKLPSPEDLEGPLAPDKP